MRGSTAWRNSPCGSGLNLAPGQELVMTASVEALDLSRRITEQAYKAGASPGDDAAVG